MDALKSFVRSNSKIRWIQSAVIVFATFARPTGPVELHHHGKRGRGQKASDFLVVPLTTLNHRRFHDSGAVHPFTAEQTRAAIREWQAESLAAFLEGLA